MRQAGLSTKLIYWSQKKIKKRMYIMFSDFFAYITYNILLYIMYGERSLSMRRAHWYCPNLSITCVTRNKKQCKNWIIGWYCILPGDIENKKEVHNIFYHQRKALIYQPMFCLVWCPKVWKILKCFKWKDLKSVEMKIYFILFNQYRYWKEYFDKIAIMIFF